MTQPSVKSQRSMEDLKTIALSALICEAASRIGYTNVKPKQLEAILEFCEGKMGKMSSFPCRIVVVVRTLAVLMAEHKRKFVPMGVNAEFLGNKLVLRILTVDCNLSLSLGNSSRSLAQSKHM